MHSELFDILYAQKEKAAKSRIWSIEDSKLWYVTPQQSRYFLQLQRDKQYQDRTVLPEQELLTAHVKEIGKFPHIVDLGCGDGTQALVLLQEMPGNMTYYPVDASADMLKEAEHNARTLGFAVKPIQGDLTEPETIKGIPSPKLLLLLGNTVTNFEEAELLKSVKKGMSAKDRILIGTTRGTKLNTTTMPMHTPNVPWSLNMLKAMCLKALRSRRTATCGSSRCSRRK
jgi:uncharacterized SAM-dependent methyltransferase